MGGRVNKLVNVCFEDGKCKVLGSEHYYYTTAYIIITLPALAMSIRAGDGYTGVSPFVLLPQPPAPASRFSYPGTRALPCLALSYSLIISHFWSIMHRETEQKGQPLFTLHIKHCKRLPEHLQRQRCLGEETPCGKQSGCSSTVAKAIKKPKIGSRSTLQENSRTESAAANCERATWPGLW